jgi:hypothetical protein
MGELRIRFLLLPDGHSLVVTGAGPKGARTDSVQSYTGRTTNTEHGAYRETRAEFGP